MTLGVAPQDVFHNGFWYDRNGNGPLGVGGGSDSPILVSGNNTVGSIKTASVPNGNGTIQWARYNASTGGYVSDIAGQTSSTYRIAVGDSGFIVGAYLTSYQPFSHGTTPTIVPSVPSFLGQVGTGTFIMDAKHATNTQSFTRSPHWARVNITSLQIVIPNWYVTGQTEVNGTGSATWTASIEYPAGVFTQAKFGGLNSGVASPGANLITDAISVAIPEGSKFWVRMFQVTTGQIMFFQFYAGDGTAQAAYGTSGVTDMTMGGTAATVASVGAFMTLPCAIIANTTVPAVGIYGDSISVGRGDSDGAGRALQGHAGRSFGASYPTGHVGVSGDRIQAFLSSNSKRIGLSTYFSHIALNMGINDVSSARTASQIQNDTNTMIGLFGAKPVSVYSMSPVSDSTDAWTTVANQTLRATTPNAVRSAVNTQRLTNLSLARNVYDVNLTVENISSPEDSIWNVNGGANTNDGTHHNANSASNIAANTDISLLVF